MEFKHGIFSLLIGAIIVENCVVNGAVKFTNIKCEAIDKSFSSFEYCYLKAVNRSYQYMSLKIRLFQVPIKNVTVNVDLLKRASGYRPFLYNITFDGCRFLRHQNSNQIAKYIYDAFKPFTNLNHTCPYDHDLFVDRLSTMHINNHMTNVLPFPLGEYRLDTKWHIDGVLRIIITAFVNFT